MNKISNIKRTRYVGAALALVLSSVPMIPVGSAFAAEACANTEAELSTYLADASMDTISFCGDLTSEPLVVLRSVKIDLNNKTFNGSFYIAENANVEIANGKVVSSTRNAIESKGIVELNDLDVTSGGPVAVYGVAGSITVKSGNYNNGIIKGNVSVEGGTFSSDPSGFLADGYAAYKVGDKYVVEPKLTLNDVVFPTSLEMYEGEVINDLKTLITIKNGSQTGFKFALGNAAQKEFAEVTHGTGKMVAKKYGKVELIMASTFENDVRVKIPVTIKSGLINFELLNANGIDISVLDLEQEEVAELTINPETKYGVANDVKYSVETNDRYTTARIEDGKLVIDAGNEDNGKTKTVTATVYAKVGDATIVTKTVTINVNPLLKDFSLAQADDNGVIAIKENQWFALAISDATSVNPADVKIVGIEVVDDGGVMHANEDRIAGDKKGEGEATIKVTAEYIKGDNRYTLTKEFTVNVVTALENIAVREASDTNNKGVKYGSDAGETSLVEIDKKDVKDLKVSINKKDAAVNVEIISSDDTVAKVEQDGRNFKVTGMKTGEATITVKVTPVGGDETLKKEFKVKVNPILEDITIVVASGIRTMTDNFVIDQGDSGQIIATVNDNLDETDNITYTFREVKIDKNGNIAPIGVPRLIIDKDGNFTSGLTTKTTTTVEVTARDSKNRIVSKIIKITLNATLQSLTLENEEITIYQQDSAQIKIKQVVADSIKGKVKWSYEGYDKNIVKVSEDGKITGLGDGKTQVTVVGTFISPLGKEFKAYATVKIVVKPLLTRVRIRDAKTNGTLDGSTQTLYELDEMKYNITHENKNAPVEYRAESSNEEVATAEIVDGQLVVRTKENTEDKALIKVYARDTETGKEVFAKMTVKAKPTLKEITTDAIIIVKKGGETNIKVGVENSKITPEFEYTSDDKTVAKVDENGKITATGVGVTAITVKASYDGKTLETTLAVSVYDIDADVSDEEKVAHDTIARLLEEATKDGANTPEAIAALLNELGLDVFGEEEMAETIERLVGAISEGQTINTKVNVVKITPDTTTEKDIKTALGMINPAGIEYFDVTVTLEVGGDIIGQLHTLDKKITIAVAEVEEPLAGYIRTYYVVRYHNGEAELLNEGEGFVVKDGKIYIISDKFSVFGVAYEDKLIPKAPDTGKETRVEVSSSASALISAAALAMIVAMAGAIKLAKRKQ